MFFANVSERDVLRPLAVHLGKIPGGVDILTLSDDALYSWQSVGVFDLLESAETVDGLIRGSAGLPFPAAGPRCKYAAICRLILHLLVYVVLSSRQI